MSASSQGDAMHKYSCRCFNITINAGPSKPEPANKTEPDYLRAFVGEDGIRITHNFLTLRTRFRAQKSPNSPNKLIQPLALSCLACNTLAYRVVQEIPPEAEAREGPVVPTEDWVEQETLRSKSGWVEVFVGRGGCLVGQRAIEQYSRSVQLSRTFSIGVLSHPPITPSTPTSPQSQIFSLPSSETPPKPALPDRILPTLPPLFPPPPFTPSHPVFISLSACAIEKSTELRLRAEEETIRFVQSRLDSLEREEAQLRGDVEGIWRGYREGWKETLGKVQEERRLSTASKPDNSVTTASAKSGVPMSIRDFSPVFRSHPRSQQTTQAPAQTVRPPSPSLLSASLAHGSAHFPIAVSLSPETTTTTPMHPSQSHGVKSPTTLSRPVNGTRSPVSSSISIKSTSDTRTPGAFRRNMDSSIDVASSLAWAKGEEEMRRRLGGGESEPTERARKRTSKNLGIGAVEKIPDSKPAPATEELEPAARSQDATHQPVRNGGATKAKVEVAGPSQGSDKRSPQTESSDASVASKKAKRRVTFDVLPDVATMTQAIPERTKTHDPEVELFDIDDLSSPEPASDVRSARPLRPQPVTRTPSYKLRANDTASTFQPASMPIPHAIPSSVNGASRWIGGSLKRSVGLEDALPLLSSSVPAGDRVLSGRAMALHERATQSSRTPSPPAPRVRAHVPHDEYGSPPSVFNDAMEPAETELKALLAASAPSHRHAWREGGKAWEIFHNRSRTKKKVKGAIAEEGSDQTNILEDSESSSDDENEPEGEWRNPSQFASSLPVQIRPLAEYKPSLEPKTSLAERQGLLVPPLKGRNSHSNSASAFRKAAYAERDRIRSIDPGPTLDFSEENEEEEDLAEVGEGERGRRHALSILQARSVVPEAGMWRSMAS